jgi:hypothetical protein
MDVTDYRGVIRQWDFNSYMLATSPNQYALENDTLYHTSILRYKKMLTLGTFV